MQPGGKVGICEIPIEAEFPQLGSLHFAYQDAELNLHGSHHSQRIDHGDRVRCRANSSREESANEVLNRRHLLGVLDVSLENRV